MAGQLADKRVAILVADGFEEVELTEPREALERAGAQADVISPAEKRVKAWNHLEWGDQIAVDVPLDEADAGHYHALLLPGGVMNPDKLRRNPTALRFVKAFFDRQRPVAVICHGPWTLIDAGVVNGRRITSYPSLQTDLENAGAQWVDEQVVVDRGLISSRKPDDIPLFNQTMLDVFSKHQERTNSPA
ncbi:protease [Nitrospira sp. KM1]|uniref:type 1 glutamine amidotransferase domain-containing protein n=1 Tax=Nitrospira sp. KM1 TaxID=1936990 RepID=UPI0013A78E2C|nr:type 1 glutamine amidotransferase domain-containing protein [Nitrospira sp. KM1]BCA57156.1 protease [Nitrospira sp. KM1]